MRVRPEILLEDTVYIEVDDISMDGKLIALGFGRWHGIKLLNIDNNKIETNKKINIGMSDHSNYNYFLK